MLLSYLLRTSLRWQNAEVCVKLVVPDEAAAESARANLQAIIAGLRIGAEAEVIVGRREEFPTILRRASADADLIFMGLAEPGAVPDFTAYYEKTQAMVSGLPTTAFVLASENLDFAEVLI